MTPSGVFSDRVKHGSASVEILFQVASSVLIVEMISPLPEVKTNTRVS